MRKELEYLCMDLLLQEKNRWLYALIGEFFEDEKRLGIDKAEEILYDKIQTRLKKEI